MNGGNEGMKIFFLMDENKFDWQDKVKKIIWNF